MSAHLKFSDFCPLCHKLLPKHLKGGVHPECHRRQLRELRLSELETYERAVKRERREASAKSLTSGQKYIVGLRRAFGYKSDREIYRLIREIPGINVQEQFNKALTSHNVVIAFGTNREGPLRLPFAPETESVTFCSGEWNKVEVKQLKLELKHPHKTSGEGQAVLREHPYGVFDFPLNVSGETFGLVCHIKS